MCVIRIGGPSIEGSRFPPSGSSFESCAIARSAPTTQTNTWPVSFRDQVLYGVPRTRLLSDQEEDSEETVVLPIDFRREQPLGQTNLLAKLVVHWGEVPIPLVRLLNP